MAKLMFVISFTISKIFTDEICITLTFRMSQGRSQNVHYLDLEFKDGPV